MSKYQEYINLRQECLDRQYNLLNTYNASILNPLLLKDLKKFNMPELKLATKSMTKKELKKRIDNQAEHLDAINSKVNKLIISDRLAEVINLILDHLKLEVKDEDYVAVEKGIFPWHNQKVVKTRQVLVDKNQGIKTLERTKTKNK